MIESALKEIPLDVNVGIKYNSIVVVFGVSQQMVIVLVFINPVLDRICKNTVEYIQEVVQQTTSCKCWPGMMLFVCGRT